MAETLGSGAQRMLEAGLSMPEAGDTAAIPAERSDAVAVAYVHGDEVAHSWHHCMWRLHMADLATHRRVLRGGIIPMRGTTGELVTARNEAVRRFLDDGDAPWLLWLDTDMGFPPDVVEQLVAAADPEKRPIVGALCFSQRALGTDGFGGYQTVMTPTIFDWVSVAAGEGQQLEGFEPRDYPPGQLVRCAGTGSAAILIHRGVLERIRATYGAQWYHRVPARDGFVAEDLSFCMRCMALGIPVHVHTGVRTTHLKRVWLAESDYLEQSSVPPATKEVAVLVPVLGRPEHAEPFMASLRASTGLARCYAVCDDEDADAVRAWKAAGATVVSTTGCDETTAIIERDHPGTFAEKVNIGYRVTHEPWLLLTGSDVRFHPGWLDQALAAADDRFHVVGTNDLGNPLVLAGVHSPHPLIRRSYVDRVGASWDGPGVVCHEGYAHNYVDQEVVVAAKQRGVWAMALASKVEHLHPLWLKGKPDKVYELGQKHVEADKELFKRRAAEYLGDVEVTVIPTARTGVAAG